MENQSPDSENSNDGDGSDENNKKPRRRDGIEEEEEDNGGGGGSRDEPSEKTPVKWVTELEIAQTLGIELPPIPYRNPIAFLSQCGLYVLPSYYDVSLHLYNNPDLCRELFVSFPKELGNFKHSVMQYAPKAVDLLKEYYKLFPKIFKRISEGLNYDPGMYNSESVEGSTGANFGDNLTGIDTKEAMKVMLWVRSQDLVFSNFQFGKEDVTSSLPAQEEESFYTESYTENSDSIVFQEVSGQDVKYFTYNPSGTYDSKAYHGYKNQYSNHQRQKYPKRNKKRNKSRNNWKKHQNNDNYDNSNKTWYKEEYQEEEEEEETPRNNRNKNRHKKNFKKSKRWYDDDPDYNNNRNSQRRNEHHQNRHKHSKMNNRKQHHQKHQHQHKHKHKNQKNNKNPKGQKDHHKKKNNQTPQAIPHPKNYHRVVLKSGKEIYIDADKEDPRYKPRGVVSTSKTTTVDGSAVVPSHGSKKKVTSLKKAILSVRNEVGVEGMSTITEEDDMDNFTSKSLAHAALEFLQKLRKLQQEEYKAYRRQWIEPYLTIEELARYYQPDELEQIRKKLSKRKKKKRPKIIPPFIKRFVFGFSECIQKLKFNQVRNVHCILLTTDIEKVTGSKGTMAKIAQIKELCRNNPSNLPVALSQLASLEKKDVTPKKVEEMASVETSDPSVDCIPYGFCISRKSMGSALGKPVKVSCVCVLNYKKVEKEFFQFMSVLGRHIKTEENARKRSLDLDRQVQELIDEPLHNNIFSRQENFASREDLDELEINVEKLQKEQIVFRSILSPVEEKEGEEEGEEEKRE